MIRLRSCAVVAPARVVVVSGSAALPLVDDGLCGAALAVAVGVTSATTAADTATVAPIVCRRALRVLSW
ncbi:hypothetical protein GCM10010433_74590 [Streptomyces pulveraceus]